MSCLNKLEFFCQLDIVRLNFFENNFTLSKLIIGLIIAQGSLIIVILDLNQDLPFLVFRFCVAIELWLIDEIFSNSLKMFSVLEF